MKKFLIAGSGLAAVAAAGSAGAVDVTLGGSIEMGIEYGLGKKHDGFTFTGSSAYQDITLNISAAGTSDAGLKFGGSFSINSAEEMKLNLYDTNGTAAGGKHMAKLVNTDASAGIKGVAYNVSGGKQVLAGSMVSVKINSAWQGAKSKLTGYDVDVGSIAADSVICKIAGKPASVIATTNQTLERATAANGNNVADRVTVGAAGDGYLNAGQLADLEAGNAAEFMVLDLTAATANGTNIAVFLAADDDAAPAAVDGATALDGDKFDVGLFGNEDGAANAHGDFDDADDTLVEDASVYVGPYAEVKMTSSTTKMVVGAVCVTNDVDASETVAYLDPASRILEVSNASIFLEGGFGKLTLQQGDYSGKVAAIGAAGDQATRRPSPALASWRSSKARPSWACPATVRLTLVPSKWVHVRTTCSAPRSTSWVSLLRVEMEDVQPDSDNEYIDNWDMGTSYAIGDLSMDFVLDSASDWAVSASASVAGFTASSVIENVATGASKKSGLSIDTTLSTDFNGISVSIGLDEDMDYTLSGSYALGSSGLAITASYDSEDNGGKVAAKMSF